MIPSYLSSRFYDHPSQLWTNPSRLSTPALDLVLALKCAYVANTRLRTTTYVANTRLRTTTYVANTRLRTTTYSEFYDESLEKCSMQQVFIHDNSGKGLVLLPN